jgi:hypothetical protein
VQRLHPALHRELESGISGAELDADQTGSRGDRDDVLGALPSHDGQDGAGDIHRAEQIRLELLSHLRARNPRNTRRKSSRHC